MARSALIPMWEGFSIGAALSGFSKDQLLTLLRGRPDLAVSPPKDLAALTARASSWPSINACMITLNRSSQQLLDALCLLPQPTTIPALVRLLNTEVDADDLDATLGRLEDLALVFRRGNELRIHPQLEGLDSPAGLGPPAKAILGGQSASVLEAAARRLGAKPGRNKAETLAALISALSDPDQVKRALQDAPTGTAGVAAQLAEHGIGTVSSGTYYIRSASPLGWLADRGMIVATDWATVAMPREVGLALRGGRPFPDFSLRPPTIQWRAVQTASVERACIDRALRLVADIAAILDGWQDAPPRRLKAGGIGIRDVRRATSATGRSEIEAAQLIEFASIAGLARWDVATETAMPLPAYDDWLDLGMADRWVTVVISWMDAMLHVNLAGATGTNGKPIPPMLDRSPEHSARHRRKLVLAALLGSDTGRAADADTLASRVSWDAPAAWTGGPAAPRQLISWVLEEAEMLGVCASGALSSLGRAAVTGQAHQAVAALAAHAPQITSQFVMQADLTAVATGPLAATVRADLELMAELESSGAATVYRFSEQSLHRAYDAGRTAAEIISFLESHASKGVPQPLTYLVEDVGRRHGRIRVGSATCYVRSDDPSLLAEILPARRLAKLRLRQLAPTVLVSAAPPATVIATLRASGYLPAEEDSSGALIVRRREVRRAFAERGHTGKERRDTSGSGLAAQLTAELAEVAGDTHDTQSTDPELESVVRRLLTPTGSRRSAVAGSGTPATPARQVTGTGTNGSSPAPAAISQLDLLDEDDERPREIAKSPDAILWLLERSFEHEWMLRLEYTNKQSRSQQINAAVLDIDAKQVTVGTMPGYGIRTLTISRIWWARALTEAEENAL